MIFSKYLVKYSNLIFPMSDWDYIQIHNKIIVTKFTLITKIINSIILNLLVKTYTIF